MSAPDAARGPTARAFANLLNRLGPDAERAGAAYEHLHRALVSYFSWRGATTPEECADETLDRLARRLDEGVVIEDLGRFARGIARLVLLEHWRRPDARRASLDEAAEGGVAPDEAADEAADEALLECLGGCLDELPSEGRDLILEYYAAEGRRRIDTRKRLARTLGLSESALRNRAQRLRDRLESCLTRCLGDGAPRDDTKG
jgi:DNA-directed RNA polymerase specialized sigma24 family protein